MENVRKGEMGPSDGLCFLENVCIWSGFIVCDVRKYILGAYRLSLEAGQ